MPFKIRLGDEVMHYGENQVGIVMEETASSYLVLIATEDVTKTWHKTEAKGWRQKVSNKSLEQTEKKASEKKPEEKKPDSGKKPDEKPSAHTSAVTSSKAANLSSVSGGAR